jgi:acyl-CoA thioester hydrolase
MAQIPAENNYLFSIELAVRDYECDIQGIVNNANYQHYLEHARHEFLISRGISFAGLHNEGLDLILTRIEIDYKYPLRSLDKFAVRLNIRREGNIRVVFYQDIFRLPDGKLIVKASVESVATKNGKPVAPGKLISRLGIND